MTPPTPSRFNPWPLGIIAAFVVFIAGTIALIVIASHDRAELVAPDYYDQEIAYQQRLDQLRRTELFAHQVDVAFDDATRTVRIALPPGHAAAGLQGDIEFYRPSRAGQDRVVPLATTPEGRQAVGAADLETGLWKVRLHWQVGDVEYYADRSLVVPAR